MPNNKMSPELLFLTHGAIGRDAGPRPSLTARLAALLQAGRFDRMLAVGVPAPEGTALAAHETRLTSVAEREAIARSLRQAVHDAHNGGTPLCSRVPVHQANITAAEDVIDADHAAAAFAAAGERARHGAAATYCCPTATVRSTSSAAVTSRAVWAPPSRRCRSIPTARRRRRCGRR